AESGWAGPAERDIDRTLTATGREDAAQAAAVLRVKQVFPNRFYTSNASRARETAEIFLQGLSLRADRLIVKPKSVNRYFF
ncbi:MAG: histidine phosphatase family protein, partial [Bacteroidetes bacterium]|nr:histidine phosphatase family protein [Bacteroidota bacterium]